MGLFTSKKQERPKHYVTLTMRDADGETVTYIMTPRQAAAMDRQYHEKVDPRGIRAAERGR